MIQTLKVSLAIALLTLSILLLKTPPAPTFAQIPCQQNSTTPRAQGLVSAVNKSLSTKFGNPQGNCVIDPKAEIKIDRSPHIQIDSYEAIFANYYTKNKTAAKSENSNTSIPTPIAGKNLYHRTGDLTVASLTNTGTNAVAIAFIEGNLFITGNIDFAQTDQSSGIVFVVRGNIYINPNVTTINAVLISQGIICTAYDISDPNCIASIVVASPLTVNGSLISLAQSKPARLKRSLLDNTNPAEIINAQAKYLVILKDLLADSLTIRYEDTNFSTNLGVAPPPPPPPPPTPPPGGLLTGLISYWKMDDTGTNVADVTGTNNGTTSAAGVSTVTGKIGNARKFDDPDPDPFITGISHMDMGTSNSLMPPQGTISMWVNIPADPGSANILTRSAGYPNSSYQIRASTSPTGYSIYVDYYNAPGSVTRIDDGFLNNLLYGSWYHIVTSWSGTQAKLYINGALINTIALTAVNNSANSAFAIGKIGPASFQSFQYAGVIDEVGVWNRALTPEEIYGANGYARNLWSSGAGLTHPF